MFPKNGNKLPRLNDKQQEADFAKAISKALAADVGGSHIAAKTIVLWTGASERSARHWLNGDYGPKGWHLLMLARNSPTTMRAILSLAGHPDIELNIEVAVARAALARAISMLDALLKRSRSSSVSNRS
jgi:hypothetical protein